MSLILIFDAPGGTPTPASSVRLDLPLSGVATLVYPWGVQASPGATGVVDPNCRIGGAVDPNIRRSGAAGEP